MTDDKFTGPFIRWQEYPGGFLIAGLCQDDKDQLDRIEAKLDQLLSRQ